MTFEERERAQNFVPQTKPNFVTTYSDFPQIYPEISSKFRESFLIFPQKLQKLSSKFTTGARRRGADYMGTTSPSSDCQKNSKSFKKNENSIFFSSLKKGIS